MPIYLNEFSKRLQVERRRIYDIINILEGFDIVVKKGKNIYIWKGLAAFNLKLKILDVLNKKKATNSLKIFNFESMRHTSKKKSLTYLSIEFLKKYYKKNSSFSFKEIIKHFRSQQTNIFQSQVIKPGSYKNKIRRLYDIINVFKALGMLSKTVNSLGKTVFVWKEEIGHIDRRLSTPPKKNIFKDDSMLRKRTVF